MPRFSETIRIGAILTFVVVLSATVAFGQQVTGTILGRVTDTSGSVVPGATIQILNVDTSFSRTAQADADGRYLISNLPLGSYTVTAQKQGFKTLVRSGITLTVGSQVTVNAELAVGAIQQRVEVTGEAPAIETSNATISGLVNPEQIRDLPLNGRSVDQLALLSPGVLINSNATRNTAIGTGIHLSVNGGRPDSMLFLLDGTVVNDATNNSHGSATGQSLGVESILEFRLLTHNFSAEYGRNGGAVESAVTRSGTNEFHGSAYEFVRNNIFDARNFFNPGALPPFRRNQFGAAAGGPIIKNRLFFFANYEGLRQRQGNTLIGSVPDDNARLGILPCSTCSGGTMTVPVNPAVKPYLALYPEPNGSNHGDGTANYITNFSSQNTENYAFARMDFRMSDKDSFYFRYVYDPSESVAPEALPIYTTPISTTQHLVLLSETHVFSGTSLNEFRFAFNRTFLGQDSLPAIQIDPALSFVPGQPFGTITFSASVAQTLQLSALGSNTSAKLFSVQNLFQGTDTFTRIRGAHSLKFGVDLQRVQLNTLAGTNARGTYQFTGLTNLLAGTPSQFRILLTGPQSNPERGWRRIDFGAFIQDDYRVRPNLTLNMGLRYEFFTNPSEVHGWSADLINVTDPANTLGPPFESSKLNFAPRVGLAWDPTGKGKTSVRLGAGVFYNFVDGRTWYTAAGSSSSFIKSYSINTPVFPNAVASLSQGQLSQLQANNSMDFHLKMPTVVQYNLEVQHQLTPSLSLRAGYVGSIGYNLTALTAQEIRIPQVQPDGSLFFPANAPFINPNFAELQRVTADAQSNYNALQVVLLKSFSTGLTFQGSYTYSKNMSTADEITAGQILSTAATPLDIHNLSRDYSLSAYDQRHTLVFTGSYQLPWDRRLSNRVEKAVLGGWAINGIYSYGSGLPFDVLTGFNNSRNGDAAQPDRPNLTPGFSQNPIYGTTGPGCQGVPANQPLHTPTRWFNPCAFTLNAPGTFGNLGRNTAEGPGLSDVDMALVKLTTVTERTKLEFRAESFNLFNHANFGLPNLNVFNSSGNRNGNAGQIIQTTTNNRDIQLGLKLIF